MALDVNLSVLGYRYRDCRHGGLPMTLQITWIAHGATAATRRAAFPGDEPLEDKARAKAAGLAAGTRSRRSRAGGARAPGAGDGGGPGPGGHDRRAAPGLRPWKLGGAFAGRDPGRGAGGAGGLAHAIRRPIPMAGRASPNLIRRVAAWCDSPERGEGRVLAITHPAVMRAALVHALGAGADGLLADRRRTALPPDPVAPGRPLATAGAGEARLPSADPAAPRARQAPGLRSREPTRPSHRYRRVNPRDEARAPGASLSHRRGPSPDGRADSL